MLNQLLSTWEVQKWVDREVLYVLAYVVMIMITLNVWAGFNEVFSDF